MTHCYYCGAPDAQHPLQVSKSFTAGALVKTPSSDAMCWQCHGIMFGDMQRAWFFKDERWVALYMRGVSQLWQGDKLLCPTLSKPQEHCQTSASGNVSKPATYPVLSHIPTRVEQRDWLLNPPDPPFKIAIAESGQKHILYLAETGYSRDMFPVQFEEDGLWLDRKDFEATLGVYEKLLALEFSKTEINSGNYRPDRVAASFERWQELEPVIADRRNGDSPSRYLSLVSHVAQRPEWVEPQPKACKKESERQLAVSVNQSVGQLTLF